MSNQKHLLSRLSKKEITIGIVGLGYVGLPLAVEFGKKFRTVGFDINQTRIDELNNGEDKTLEVSAAELKQSTQLSFAADPTLLAEANVFIVTVPTPIDRQKKPDLTPLQKASNTIGAILKEILDDEFGSRSVK